MTDKILIIGPSWIGDMVMAQSLFKLIKQRHPHTLIDVLASSWTFPLLSRMPQVSRILANPLLHGELKLTIRYQLAKKLQMHQYDQAIVLPNSFKSAFIPWLAGIPKRTGWLGEYRYGLLNDIRYLDKKRHHLMVEQFMQLGLAASEPLPAVYPYPDFYVSTTQQQTILATHQPIWRGQPILALCIGAQFGTSKRWPEAYFAEVANQKMKEGWDIWLFGSEAEKPIAEKIMQLTKNRCENLVGRINLHEAIDLLSLVSGAVTNDSGLMHITAALNKPLIALYGSTSPNFTPPLSASATILKLNLNCQPCFKRECPLEHHRCMQDLLPEQVLAAMTKWKM
ncbi:MAG: lipopolysaccharide heptosyltransferase II [Gammaproteobacteria bacterium RIFCSPHIGHO2_12_FULL_37_14]|nr:MAG: lipopolysaccharide heptosyltransferase II [Gammaproteobacteria bacterium RIFCSPHIGHO2_12_FULL_37_14]